MADHDVVCLAPPGEAPLDTIAESSRGKAKAFVAHLTRPLTRVTAFEDELFLARTPDQAWWVLWRERDTLRDLGRHPLARVPNDGRGARAAALTLVEARWQWEREQWGRVRPHRYVRTGLLHPYHLERLVDAVWPFPGGVQLVVTAAFWHPCGCRDAGIDATCDVCGATGAFDRWVPYGEFTERAIYRARFGVEPHGPHRPFVEAMLTGLQGSCRRCFHRNHSSGFTGHTPDELRVCDCCEGTGWLWLAEPERRAAALGDIAQVHPDIIDPHPPVLRGVAVEWRAECQPAPGEVPMHLGMYESMRFCALVYRVPQEALRYAIELLSPHRDRCTRCKGTGGVVRPTSDGPRPCPRCEGTGGGWFADEETLAAIYNQIRERYPNVTATGPGLPPMAREWRR